MRKESRLLSVQPILDADVLDCRPVDRHGHRPHPSPDKLLKAD
jgi:hypothetical protein